MSSPRWRMAAHCVAVCTVLAVMTANAMAQGSGSAPVVAGLDGPRGVVVGPAGRVVFTENDGSFSEVVVQGHNAGAVIPLGGVPATYIAPSIATDGRGQIDVLAGSGAPGSGATEELAAGDLVLPAGVAVGRDGAVYVTGPVFGPGSLTRIE